MLSQVLQSIPDVSLYRRVWGKYCLRINCCKQNLYTFLLNNQKLSFSVMSVFLLPSIVSTWIMARKLNSRKVRNCCIHIKYLVNGSQPGDTFTWDKSTILSTISSWEINYGESNITVHSMSTKDVVLSLFKFWKTFWIVWQILKRNSWKVTNLFPSTNLDIIEKELMRSTKSYHALNKHRYIMDFWINPR